MSQNFGDLRRIKKRAKRKPEILDVVQRHWVRKYKLPPHHELWRHQAFTTHLEEFLTDLHLEKGELLGQLSPSQEPWVRQQMTARIDAINELLADEESEELDDTIDLLDLYWSEQMDHDEEPDFDMTESKLKAMGWRPGKKR